MSNYVKKMPNIPSFKQNGFDGYNIETDNKNISITFEDVYEKHEKYCTNTKSTHFYFVVDGNGQFKINNDIYEVGKDDLIEIPPNNKFVFSGRMKLLLIMNPEYNEENDIAGEDNDLD